MVHFINNANTFFCNSSVINNKHEVLLVSVLEFGSRGTASSPGRCSWQEKFTVPFSTQA